MLPQLELLNNGMVRLTIVNVTLMVMSILKECELLYDINYKRLTQSLLFNEKINQTFF